MLISWIYLSEPPTRLYHNLGYVIYRQVLGYYSGEEDAYGTSGI